MNKNKITMCVIGGISLLVVLVFAYLTYSAYSDKVEKLDELDAAVSRVQNAGKEKIAPAKDSKDALDANREKLAQWKKDAIEEASVGDIAIDPGMTPSEFRQRISEYVKAEAALPGGVDGKIAKDDFYFGFDALRDGLPAASELAVLQRQWSDVKFIVDTLSACGAIEVVSVAKADAKQPEVVEEPPKRGAKKTKKVEPPKPLADTQSYTIKFIAKQVALVKALNAVATAERFIVIDEFSFFRTRDTLKEALSEKDKDAPSKTSGSKRPRNKKRNQEEAESAGEAQDGSTLNKKGLVFDPANDVPFEVELKFTTYDFCSKAKVAEDGKEAE